MNFLENDKKFFLILFVIYFIINVPILMNFNGIYWDDWVLINQDLDTLNDMFIQALGYAGYIIGYLHYLIINYFGVFTYKILTFIFLFLSGWFVFKILNTLALFSKKDAVFLMIFFLLAPLYNGKIALINFPYTLFSFIFFLAFYLLSNTYGKLVIRKRIFILSLFFISFLVNSILVFYAIVLIYIFYINYSLNKSIFKNVIDFIKTNMDFIFLPIVFYIIKSVWFKSFGEYERYNEINLILGFNIETYKQLFLFNFFEPILLSIKPFFSIFICCFFIFTLYAVTINKSKEELPRTNNILFLFGIIIFLLGAFPYLVVAKMPMLSDWFSRFQLLLPLGFSFILYYGLNLVFRKGIKNFLFLTLIFSFSMFHISEQIKYNIDWLYQQSIIENFKNNEIIKNNTTFIVLNNLENNLAQNRQLRFYELNGMSKLAFEEDSRLFISNEKEIEKYKKYQFNKNYNFLSWKFTKPIYLRFVNNYKYKLNIDTIGRLKYLEITNKEQFNKEIKDLVILEFK